MASARYQYGADARFYGLRRLLWGVGVSALGMLLSLFWWTFVVGVAGALILTVGAYLLLSALLRMILGGRWEISADENGLHWRAPYGIEKSFKHSLAELDRLELRRAIKPGAEGQTRYCLIANGGRERELLGTSGVDLAALADTLSKLGVDVEEVRVL